MKLSLIDRHSSAEHLRQIDILTNMSHACDHYIDELLATLSSQLDNITTGQNVNKMYSANTSISFVLHHRNQVFFDFYLEMVNNFMEEYKLSVMENVTSSIAGYRRYLQNVLNTDWFNFPQHLFNESQYFSVWNQSPNYDFLGYEADFGAFIEVEEIESLRLWPVQLWNRQVSLGYCQLARRCDCWRNIYFFARSFHKIIIIMIIANARRGASACSAMQVQCSPMQCMHVQCSACSAMHVQCSAMQCNAGAMQCTAILREDDVVHVEGEDINLETKRRREKRMCSE